jgi:hypothetical protein
MPGAASRGPVGLEAAVRTDAGRVVSAGSGDAKQPGLNCSVRRMRVLESSRYSIGTWHSEFPRRRRSSTHDFSIKDL